MTAWQSGPVTDESGYVRQEGREQERGLAICGQMMLSIAVELLVPSLARGSSPVTDCSLSPQLHF